MLCASTAFGTETEVSTEEKNPIAETSDSESTKIVTQPKIVTSITPIGSIIAMVTRDAAQIVAIDASSGCPHHYHMKPSDKDKVNNANMMVYIDNHFDGFAGRLFEGFQGKVIKISDIKSVKLKGSSDKINWHIWLDLNNALALQEEVVSYLSSEFPAIKDAVLSNLEESRVQIAELMKLKADALKSVGELVVLSHSLEHFFTGSEAKITKLYQKSNSSLNDFAKLDSTLNVDSDLCIVLDSTQDPKAYEKYNKKIVQLESENWVLDDCMHGDSKLFYNKYINIINNLKACK